MKKTGHSFLIMTLMLVLSTMAQADTLELRDGRLVDGDYVGGSRGTIRFETGAGVEVIPTDDVLALTFSSAGPSAAGHASSLSLEKDAVEALTLGTLLVPAGTRLLVRLEDDIDSGEDGTGSRFTAVLETNLDINGRLLARKGSRVYGHLTSAQRGGRAIGKGELRLELTDIVINDRRYPILTGEYKIQGRSQGTAKKTLGGALLGALIDGSDGAKTGAAAGLGLSLLTKGKQASISSGTLIEFRLQEPLVLHA